MDNGFDFRQILTFKKKRHVSLIFFILILIVFIAARVGVSFELARRAEAEKPSLALFTLVSDLRQYQSLKSRFPVSFNELKKEVWDTQNSAANRNIIGARYFSEDNYVYFYSTEGNLCSVWAVPQGKYKDSAETIYIVLNTTNQEVWRGRALSEEQKKMIPSVVRPPVALMAQFNLVKDPVEDASQSKGRGSSFFDFFRR